MQEFKLNELQTISGNYCQSFNVNANTFPGKLSLIFNDKKFKPGVDFIVDPASPSLMGSYQSQTCTIDDLLNTKKLNKIIKASGNKVLIVDERGFKTDDKSVTGRLAEIIDFLKYSPDLKHKAFVILTDKKLTWHISQVQKIRPVFIVKSEYELADIEVASFVVEAELKTNYKTGNVLGYFSGKSIPDSMIVLTAHYDHLGQLGEGAFIPGANDNASGIAMLLTLAKYFKDNPPDYSLVFIALSAEELGLLGAQHFVENPSIDLKKIKFLVNFDLAGTGDEGIKVVNGSVFQKEFDRLSMINSEKKYLPAVKRRGEACISDHCMFYMKGIPSFYIYTLGGINAYHDINDKYETLPFTEFVDYSKLMVEFIEGFTKD